MNKIIELAVSMIIKKGIVYEARNCDINIDIPNGNEKIKVNFKADHMKLYIEKESK